MVAALGRWRRAAPWVLSLGWALGPVNALATEPVAPPARAFGARPDPMRPTPGGAGAAQPAPSVAPEAEAAGTAPPRLLSVHRLRGQAPRALIGEVWVQQGDSVGPWRVLEIAEDQVRLGRGREVMVLRMWPAALTP